MKTIQKLTILLIAILSFAPTASGNLIADTQSEEAVELIKSAFKYLESEGYSPKFDVYEGRLAIDFTVEGSTHINLQCVDAAGDKGFLMRYSLLKDLKELGLSYEKGLEVANKINETYAIIKSFVSEGTFWNYSASVVSNFYQFKYQFPNIIEAILYADEMLLDTSQQTN